MILLLSATVAIVFGAGVHLVLSRDMVRVVAGSILISNSSNLLLMAVGLSRGRAPIHPIEGGVAVSDPVVQALALTSMVISFALSLWLLTLVHQLQVTYRTLDFNDVLAAERRDESRRERSAPQ